MTSAERANMTEVRIEFDGALVEIRRVCGRFVVTRAVESGGDLALDDHEVPADGVALSLNAPSRVSFGAVTLEIDPGGSPRMRRLAARHDWWRVALVLVAAESITLALLLACVLMPRGRAFDLEVRPTIVARARLAPVAEPASRPIVTPLRPAPARVQEGIAPVVPDAAPIAPGVIRPASPRRARPLAHRPEPRVRAGAASEAGVPCVDLSGLLGRSALGDAEEAFRDLGRAPVDDTLGRDVPAWGGGRFDGTGGGGRGEGTIGLGSYGRLSTSRGDLYAPTIPQRLRPAGPLIDCLTEYPCPRVHPEVEGDALLIRRAVRRVLPRLRWCYARALVAKPTLRGALFMQLFVDRRGRVAANTSDGSTLAEGHDTIGACFRAVLETIVLPARAEPLLATYPFRLRPSAAE